MPSSRLCQSEVKQKPQLKLCVLLTIWFQIANYCTRWRCTFNGLQDGRRAKFAGNLRTSPFNKDLSNETAFSQIHLNGQYLERAQSSPSRLMPYLSFMCMQARAIVPTTVCVSYTSGLTTTGHQNSHNALAATYHYINSVQRCKP
jgi:hypothetical protein